MAVKIRLKRFGKKRAPFYRVVVMDSRTKRDGRAIEEIGKYHPTEDPSVIEIDSARALYWLGVGAQPSEQVKHLLTLTGDWQTYRGEKGATNTVQPQQPKASADVKIKEAAKAAEREKATKAKAAEESAKKAAAEAEAAKAEAAQAEAAQAEAAQAEAPAEPETAPEAPVEAEAAPDVVADESHEVPKDEGAEVDVEVAEGDPSDADDEVEGIIDEEK